VVGFLMFLSSREKSITGTPVLQGRMGGNVSGNKRSSGRVIPIADNEPILQRGHIAAPSSSVAPSLQAAADQARPVINQQPQAALPASAHIPDSTLIASNGIAPAQGATMISSSPLPPRAVLIVLNSAGSPAPQGQTQIIQFPFVIGRVEGSLIIPEANISRRHAQINYSEANRTFTITDLNSSNGTRVNNQTLVPGQPSQIVSGSVIGLGPNVTLRFDLI